MQPAGLLRTTVKKAVSHSLVYGIGMSFTAIAGILLVPLYTRFLTPGDYGVYSLISVIFGLLLFLYDFGMVNALFRWYYRYGADEAHMRKAVLNTAFVFLLVLASILTVLFWNGAGPLSRFIFHDGQFSGLIRLMLIGVFLQSLTWVPLSLLRIQERVGVFTGVTIAGMAFMLVANYLLLSFGRGLRGIYEAYIVAYLSMAAALFLMTRKEYSTDLSFTDLKGMLKFGLPYLPVLFFTWVIDFSDRYLLARLSSMQEVGLYSVGYRIGQAMYLVVKMFIVAWMPLMLSLSRDYRDKAQAIFGKIFTYFVLVMGVLFLAVSLFSREIVRIFTSASYAASAAIIPWSAFSYVLNGIYLFMLCGLIVAKNMHIQPVVLCAAAALNIALNVILIPHFGMLGSAFATVVSYLVVAAVTYFFSQRLYPIPVEWRRIVKIFLAIAVIYAVGMLVAPATLGMSLLVKGMLLVSFLYVLYLVGFFHPEEIGRLKSLWIRRRPT